MFIEIKKYRTKNIEYINIFKINSIKTFDPYAGVAGLDVQDDEKEKTEIGYTESGVSCITISFEPVKDFMKRLKKEIKEAVEIKDRFEILDL